MSKAPPEPSWRVLIREQPSGRIVGDSDTNRAGRLKVGVYQWYLKPGRYSLHCTLPGPSGALGRPENQAAWSGRIELPPADFEVVGDVSDEDLSAAARKVRAAHPAGGKPMWQALAELVRPGMTVRQVRLALPQHPANSPWMEDWSGNYFILRYGLDDQFGVEARGFGDTAPGGEDANLIVSDERMIVVGPPAIVAWKPLLLAPVTGPASGPASAPATRPAGASATQTAAADDAAFAALAELLKLRMPPDGDLTMDEPRRFEHRADILWDWEPSDWPCSMLTVRSRKKAAEIRAGQPKTDAVVRLCILDAGFVGKKKPPALATSPAFYFLEFNRYPRWRGRVVLIEDGHSVYWAAAIPDLLTVLKATDDGFAGGAPAAARPASTSGDEYMRTRAEAILKELEAHGAALSSASLALVNEFKAGRLGGERLAAAVRIMEWQLEIAKAAAPAPAPRMAESRPDVEANVPWGQPDNGIAMRLIVRPLNSPEVAMELALDVKNVSKERLLLADDFAWGTHPVNATLQVTDPDGNWTTVVSSHAGIIFTEGARMPRDCFRAVEPNEVWQIRLSPVPWDDLPYKGDQTRRNLWGAQWSSNGSRLSDRPYEGMGAIPPRVQFVYKITLHQRVWWQDRSGKSWDISVEDMAKTVATKIWTGMAATNESPVLFRGRPPTRPASGPATRPSDRK